MRQGIHDVVKNVKACRKGSGLLDNIPLWVWKYDCKSKVVVSYQHIILNINFHTSKTVSSPFQFLRCYADYVKPILKV